MRRDTRMAIPYGCAQRRVDVRVGDGVDSCVIRIEPCAAGDFAVVETFAPLNARKLSPDLAELPGARCRARPPFSFVSAKRWERSARRVMDRGVVEDLVAAGLDHVEVLILPARSSFLTVRRAGHVQMFAAGFVGIVEVADAPGCALTQARM